MGKKCTEPTPYRDRRCPFCGFYFTSRGLNGHIRFFHEGYEQHEKERLNRKLWDKAMRLCKQGHREVEYAFPLLGNSSKLSLEELRALEDGLAIYDILK